MSPVDVNVPAPVRFAPLAVNAVVPFGANTILPVPAAPMVNVCPFVVPNVPVPVKYVALFPLFAEILAVGVFPALFKKANLALLVEVPPRRTSYVLFPCDSAFAFNCQ
jgi:hypothetical protein